MKIIYSLLFFSLVSLSLSAFAQKTVIECDIDSRIHRVSFNIVTLLDHEPNKFHDLALVEEFYFDKGDYDQDKVYFSDILYKNGECKDCYLVNVKSLEGKTLKARFEFQLDFTNGLRASTLQRAQYQKDQNSKTKIPQCIIQY